MIKLVKNLIKTVYWALLWSFALVFISNTVYTDVYNWVVFEPRAEIKKYAPYTPPLKDRVGNNYCSSSIVRHRNQVFTVTNNHCCDIGVQEFGHNNVRVRDTIEKIVHRSRNHDICVLTSWLSYSPIRISSKPLKPLDKVLVMGYPRGSFLTPRFGHVIAQDISVCIPDFSGNPVCTPGDFISTTIYGGNSGSPVFDRNGRLTAVIYAGNMFIHTFGIAVPHRFVKEALDAAAQAPR